MNASTTAMVDIWDDVEDAGHRLLFVDDKETNGNICGVYAYIHACICIYMCVIVRNK